MSRRSDTTHLGSLYNMRFPRHYKPSRFHSGTFFKNSYVEHMREMSLNVSTNFFRSEEAAQANFFRCRHTLLHLFVNSSPFVKT